MEDIPGYKMIPGWKYSWSWSSEELVKHVDEAGGWPQGYNYIGFEHTIQREAGFCKSPHNSGWWTVVACADDYYFLKLSPAAVRRFTDNVLNAARVTRPAASVIGFNNSRGYNFDRKDL